jgi:hypothetical protein
VIRQTSLNYVYTELSLVARDYLTLVWVTVPGWKTAFKKQFNREPADEVELQAFTRRTVDEGHEKAMKVKDLARQFAVITNSHSDFLKYFQDITKVENGEDDYKMHKEAQLMAEERERNFDAIYPDWGDNKVWD